MVGGVPGSCKVNGLGVCLSRCCALEKREVKCERVKVGNVVTRCVSGFQGIFKVYGGFKAYGLCQLKVCIS